MSSLPAVSLIVPSLNQVEFLGAALRSAFDQDYPALEVMVVDGGSSDGSRELLQHFQPQPAWWISEPDQGQAQAINKGLRRARGDILGWLNSDDLLAPGAVRRAVEALAVHPQVDVVYGRVERIDQDGRIVPTPILPKDRVTFSRERIIGECVVNQPGSFWRRSIMERTGLPDEELQYALDYEYWIRLAFNGAQFMRLSQAAAYFRLHPGSKTVGRTLAMAVEQLEVLERMLAEPDLPARLGLSPAQVDRQAQAARARIGLHAAYGAWKLRRYGEAVHRLAVALRCDPGCIFERRWLDLAAAGARRQLGRRTGGGPTV